MAEPALRAVRESELKELRRKHAPTFWSDEPATKAEIVDLGLRQLKWLLERKHLDLSARIKVLTIVSRWVDKIEVSPKERAELLELIKSGAVSAEAVPTEEADEQTPPA